MALRNWQARLRMPTGSAAYEVELTPGATVHRKVAITVAGEGVVTLEVAIVREAEV